MSGPPWVDDPRPVVGDSRGTVCIAVQLGRVEIILWLLTGSLISLNFLVSVTGGLELLPYTVTRFFDGNDTDSFLTGTKTTLLLLATVLLFGCTVAARRRGDPSARGWQLLAVVAGFLFADETTFLHRSLAEVVHDRYHFTGAARYAWAAMYLPLVIAVVVVLARDLRRMAPAVRNRLLPGGALYAIGVVGFEPLRAVALEDHGVDSLSYKLWSAVADSAEMIGLTLVVCAVMVAASRLARGFTFLLSAAEPWRRSLAGPALDAGPAGRPDAADVGPSPFSPAPPPPPPPAPAPARAPARSEPGRLRRSGSTRR